MLQMLAWRLLAVLFVGLGLLGVIVPGMPTTVFMLLAMWRQAMGGLLCSAGSWHILVLGHLSANGIAMGPSLAGQSGWRLFPSWSA